MAEDFVPGKFGAEANTLVPMGEGGTWFTAMGKKESVAARAEAGLKSAEVGKVPNGDKCLVDVYMEIEGAKMRAHLVEPIDGWVTAKLLKCIDGKCGYCSQCDDELLPSEAAAKMRLIENARATPAAKTKPILDPETFHALCRNHGWPTVLSVKEILSAKRLVHLWRENSTEAPEVPAFLFRRDIPDKARVRRLVRTLCLKARNAADGANPKNLNPDPK